MSGLPRVEYRAYATLNGLTRKVRPPEVLTLPPEDEMDVISSADGVPYRWSHTDSAGIDWQYWRSPMGTVTRRRLTPYPARDEKGRAVLPDQIQDVVPLGRSSAFIAAAHDLAQRRATTEPAVSTALRKHRNLSALEVDELTKLFAGGAIEFPAEHRPEHHAIDPATLDKETIR